MGCWGRNGVLGEEGARLQLMHVLHMCTYVYILYAYTIYAYIIYMHTLYMHAYVQHL